jgi:hypothetical protein
MEYEESSYLHLAWVEGQKEINGFHLKPFVENTGDKLKITWGVGTGSCRL